MGSLVIQNLVLIAAEIKSKIMTAESLSNTGPDNHNYVLQMQISQSWSWNRIE